jgi:hypothetical protein
LPVVLYECETCPSHGGKILTEGIQEQAAVENFNLKVRKKKEAEEKFRVSKFVVCSHQILQE